MSKQATTFNLHHNEHSDLAASLENRYISENYSFGMSNLEVKKIGKLFKKIKKEYPNIEENSFKITGGKRVVFESDSLIIFIGVYGSGTIGFLDFFTKNRDDMNRLYRLINKFVEVEEEFIVARTSFFISDQLRTKEDFFKVKDFKSIIPDYYPEIDVTEFFKQFINSSEPILILSGQSGTGKTKFLSYMLKFLLENPKLLGLYNDFNDTEKKDYISLAYIKNEKILSNDEFWVQLKERNYDLVVLDDLDYFLSPRKQAVDSVKEEEKDKFISELLSFTDGLVKNKTKFLISTNRNIDAVDEALQRPGRLFDIFSFSELTKSQALSIWEKEGFKKKDFEKEFSSDTVLQATLGNKISEYKSNNGKPLKSYLKNKNVSVTDKFKKDKRVGFGV